MTKTSKRKLIVTSALVLGAVATVGATFGAITLSGGTQSVNHDDITVDTVEVHNQYVNIESTLTDQNIVLDGYETQADNTAGVHIATGDEQNDRTISLSVKVTGDPSLWDNVSINLAWDSAHATAAAKFFVLPTTTLEKSTDLTLDEGTTGAGTVYSGTVDITIDWATTYTGGLVNYINTKTVLAGEPGAGEISLTQASDLLDDFKAINGATLTATVAVNLVSAD